MPFFAIFEDRFLEMPPYHLLFLSGIPVLGNFSIFNTK